MLCSIHDIRGYTLPLTVTAQTSPFFFGGIVAALSVPFLIHRLPGHVIFFTAMCAFMIGNILAATAPVDGIYWGNTFFSILIGVFGAGRVFFFYLFFFCFFGLGDNYMN